MKILCILQCAYGTTEKRRKELKDKDKWLVGLFNSHTGRRLKNMLPNNHEITIINSTPEIGDKSSAVFEPDLNYIRGIIANIKPDKILACGKVAQSALEQLNVEYISAPHPAWRQLTNKQIFGIKEMLDNDY